LAIIETDNRNESFGRVDHGNDSVGGMDHGDDSTRAPDSDGESQTTCGPISEISEALQCMPDPTVDDAIDHVQDTQRCTQSSWKPNLRHTIFVPAVNATVASVVTGQTTHEDEKTSRNNGKCENRIEKPICTPVRAVAKARKPTADRCQTKLVWVPKLDKPSTSLVATPIDNVGSFSAAPLDQRTTEEKRAVDHEGEPSEGFVAEHEDSELRKAHRWSEADATPRKRTFADVVKGKHYFYQANSNSDVS
jgi:hypothetical protein